ncbi:hypothetical protein SACE_3327 [Saccharopolyspora erythraea NRRL 2338]|uniref:Transposase IS116/IS110/IS902 C-terminal domain-containing protein n=1 Tax=Saccharopolyspora erythraea (strain ATCC 11635 / DSM 40517 / JCM 4748 / NBRC 13426 / NCIMB 8594 / NRRL 2338) TaxID=405948 RepID=A4FEX7_SACEN|nr:hypothetical protein SACE_3327 [Saccharopolyspora erythraea NRRL 2338]
MRAINPALLTLPGIGPDVAGQILVTAGENTDRLVSEAAFAALCGVAPLPASSGRTHRHRLNRGGDRQANAALYRVALCRLRWDPRTHAYQQRRTTEGRTKKEIIRCLKRYIAREIYHVLHHPGHPQEHPPADLRDEDFSGDAAVGWEPRNARRPAYRSPGCVQLRPGARPPSQAPCRTWRAALAIASASMPACCSSSAGLPEPGRAWTASLRTGTRLSVAARTSSTASPRPPSGQWSSTVTMPPVCAAASRRVTESTGLTEYRSITLACTPSSASRSAARSDSCNVTPAPTRVMSPPSRTTLEPPISNDSSGG